MSTSLAKDQVVNIDHYTSDEHASTLADIYEDHINLVSWKRTLSKAVKNDIDALLTHHSLFNYRVVLTPNEISAWLQSQWETVSCPELAHDVQSIATMFAELFDVEQLGVRFELVNKTVCPYFHVDKVVSRLVTTYTGPTTEWLPEANTNRSALEERIYDGIMHNEDDLQRADNGEVMLFKGASWVNRQVEPIVHRSPACLSSQRRLLLTLDML